jgi:drug/metabolite transporter (DMT)-like permease
VSNADNQRFLLFRNRAVAVSTGMLFLCGISWGLSFSLNKIAITGGIPFVPYVFWQSLGAGLALLVLSFVTGNRPSLRREALKLYGVAALLDLVIPFLALNYVAAKLPAGIVSLGQTLVPALTFAFALMFRIERFDWIRGLGLSLGIGGVLLVLLPQTSLPSPELVGFVLIALIAPVCYGFVNILVVLMRPPQSHSIPLSAGLLLCSALFLLPVMAVTDSWWFFDNGLDDGAQALIGVTALNALFWYLLFEIIHRAGPVFFSTYNYVAPLAGIGWGIIIFDENHSVWIWAALALMLAGIFLANRHKQKRTD